MAEIGGLLMALPFISIFARPFFCALADRHQNHKLYLIGACFTLALGYGSLAIAPFYPKFIEQHGRLIWYLDMIGIIVGYTSFTVVFSLGDALALNAARKRGISWSLYRVWSTLSWGVGGYVAGVINETPGLPKYVPGIFLLVCSMILEIILVGFWSRRAFDMNDDHPAEPESVTDSVAVARTANTLDRKLGQDNGLASMEDSHTAPKNWSMSPFGTMSEPNARLMGALAGLVMEEVGSTLKSTLRRGKQAVGQQKRAGLSEMLEQHAANSVNSPKMIARSSVLTRQFSVQDPKKRLRSSHSKLAQSLGPASGLRLINGTSSSPPVRRSILKQTYETQAAPNSLVDKQIGEAVATRELADSGIEDDVRSVRCEAKKYEEDLQMLLLKFIVRRDRTIIKSLVSFTFFGFLMSIHASYFFLHVEEVCRQQGYEFSKVMGIMCIAQSISEIFSFLVLVRYYMPLVGRTGSLLSCAALFGARYVYYGTYFAEMSPYFALITESFHGFAYGMLYTSICNCASDCVEQLGKYLPELKSSGLIDPSLNENQLKLPLRATMQGVFSGAFDGLGYGLGALFGGVFLELLKDYNGLWQVSGGISGLNFLYILLTHSRSTSVTPA